MKRERFVQPARRIQAASSTATDFYSKLVEKEMQLFKINPKERPKYLELLFKALKTIKPTHPRSGGNFSLKVDAQEQTLLQ